MKKHKLVIMTAMLVFLASMLVACNKSSTEIEDKEKESEKEQRVVENRAFETIKGSVEIPAKPMRIVTDFYGGELLSVGANVVGVEPTAFDNPFIKDLLKDAVEIGQPVNVEKVLELEPDLIVVMYDENYKQLSAIAPTLHIPYGTATNIEETVKLFGDITGNYKEAEKFMSKFDQKAKAGREKLSGIIDANATFGIYELTDKNELWIFGDNAGRGGQALYNALELNIPHENKNEEQTLQLSMEVLPEYAADYMFLTTYDPEKKGQALKSLKDSSIWQGLDAMKNNQVFYNDFDTYYRYDPIAIYEQIDLFVNMLIERNKENQTK
ncbi:iron complex transport system substrate-binding protein [Filibacter limicola]|uniref:Iron complex transport system substrate-binding protein n=2 Tax=Sporosarcina limicola TaxID=34101 RepID=A0A927ML34_9BACL|nr:ABC transporter substrate-binding protein [Sporosarcina limicola]MBE1556583.1 iron complex transport system substrate-binding protein [Sporosarcina limicola]